MVVCLCSRIILPMDEEALRQHDTMERAGHDFGARNNWFEF